MECLLGVKKHTCTLLLSLYYYFFYNGLSYKEVPWYYPYLFVICAPVSYHCSLGIYLIVLMNIHGKFNPLYDTTICIEIKCYDYGFTWRHNAINIAPPHNDFKVLFQKFHQLSSRNVWFEKYVTKNISNWPNNSYFKTWIHILFCVKQVNKFGHVVYGLWNTLDWCGEVVLLTVTVAQSINKVFCVIRSNSTHLFVQAIDTHIGHGHYRSKTLINFRSMWIIL